MGHAGPPHSGAAHIGVSPVHLDDTLTLASGKYFIGVCGISEGFSLVLVGDSVKIGSRHPWGQPWHGVRKEGAVPIAPDSYLPFGVNILLAGVLVSGAGFRWAMCGLTQLNAGREPCFH